MSWRYLSSVGRWLRFQSVGLTAVQPAGRCRLGGLGGSDSWLRSFWLWITGAGWWSVQVAELGYSNNLIEVCGVFAVSALQALFGRRLQYLRRQRKLTQERLAEATEVSVDLISNIERGVNAPSFKTIEKLSTALNVSPDELFDF